MVEWPFSLWIGSQRLRCWMISYEHVKSTYSTTALSLHLCWFDMYMIPVDTEALTESVLVVTHSSCWRCCGCWLFMRTCHLQHGGGWKQWSPPRLGRSMEPYQNVPGETGPIHTSWLWAQHRGGDFTEECDYYSVPGFSVVRSLIHLNLFFITVLAVFVGNV